MGTLMGDILPASKQWRFKFRFEGKACCRSFGVDPDISLEEARKRSPAEHVWARSNVV